MPIEQDPTFGTEPIRDIATRIAEMAERHAMAEDWDGAENAFLGIARMAKEIALRSPEHPEAAEIPVEPVSLTERRKSTTLLRRLREALGLTMGEASRAFGFPVAAWSARETSESAGLTVPEIERLLCASEDLGKRHDQQIARLAAELRDARAAARTFSQQRDDAQAEANRLLSERIAENATLRRRERTAIAHEILMLRPTGQRDETIERIAEAVLTGPAAGADQVPSEVDLARAAGVMSIDMDQLIEAIQRVLSVAALCGVPEHQRDIALILLALKVRTRQRDDLIPRNVDRELLGRIVREEWSAPR